MLCNEFYVSGAVTESKKSEETSNSPNIYISRVGSSFIQLSWNPLSLAELRPDYIQFTATPANHSYPPRGQIIGFDLGSLYIDGLEPDSLYNVVAEVYGVKDRILTHNISITTLRDGKLIPVNMISNSTLDDYTHKHSSTVVFIKAFRETRYHEAVDNPGCQHT